MGSQILCNDGTNQPTSKSEDVEEQADKLLEVGYKLLIETSMVLNVKYTGD